MRPQRAAPTSLKNSPVVFSLTSANLHSPPPSLFRWYSHRSSQSPGISRVTAADLRPAQHRPGCLGFADPAAEHHTLRRFPSTSSSLHSSSYLLLISSCHCSDVQPGNQLLSLASSSGEALRATVELGDSERPCSLPTLQHAHQQWAEGIQGHPQQPLEPDIPWYVVGLVVHQQQHSLGGKKQKKNKVVQIVSLFSCPGAAVAPLGSSTTRPSTAYSSYTPLKYCNLQYTFNQACVADSTQTLFQVYLR